MKENEVTLSKQDFPEFLSIVEISSFRFWKNIIKPKKRLFVYRNPSNPKSPICFKKLKEAGILFTATNMKPGMLIAEYELLKGEMKYKLLTTYDLDETAVSYRV